MGCLAESLAPLHVCTCCLHATAQLRDLSRGPALPPAAQARLALPAALGAVQCVPRSDPSMSLAVDNEEAALLHEEATMTIEELLTRYGQNCTKNLKSKPGAAGEAGREHGGEASMNGEATPGELAEHKERDNSKPDEEATGISSTSDRAGAGGDSSAAGKVDLGRGEEAVTSSTGEAGPSCSSTGKPQRTTKSKFFEDSEDESDEAEEEEEDSEVGAKARGRWPTGWAGSCLLLGAPSLSSSPSWGWRWDLPAAACMGFL